MLATPIHDHQQFVNTAPHQPPFVEVGELADGVPPPRKTVEDIGGVIYPGRLPATAVTSEEGGRQH